MKVTVLVCLVFVSVGAFCENHALIIGGSGELVQESNFFKPDFETLTGSLKNRGWGVQTLFNGTEGKLAGSKPANNKNIAEAVSTKLKNAQPNDQVFLVFHSHGLERQSIFGEKTHKIVSEDSYGFSLDEICKPVVEAEKRGVKVAIADLSCFSGNTQSLKDVCTSITPNTENEVDPCIVSLAASSYVSICSGDPDSNSFTEAFIRIPGKEKISLEEHFLSSRQKDYSSTNLPQISSFQTPALENWELFFKETDPSSLMREDELYYGETEAAECALCSKSSAKLSDLFDKIGELNNEVLKEEFKNQLSLYLKYIHYVNKSVATINKYSELTSSDLGLSGKFANQKYSIYESYALLKLAEMTDTEIRRMGFGSDLIELSKQVKKEEIYSKLKVAHKKIHNALNQYDFFVKKIEEKASTILQLERKLYDELAKPKPGVQSCREFML